MYQMPIHQKVINKSDPLAKQWKYNMIWNPELEVEPNKNRMKKRLVKRVNIIM